MKLTRRKILLSLLGILLVLIVLGIGVFVWYVSDYARPMPEALAVLKSDELVSFQEKNGWLVFQPVNQGDAFGRPLNTGLILYPGGKVDYRAYAPLAREIASHGYLVVVPSVPFNLAFFDANVAARIIPAFPEIQQWAIAGHSLGGVAASQYIAAHPEQIQGVAFYASYPSSDLRNYTGRVLSVFGTADRVINPLRVEASKANLPPPTQFIPIQGGNHAQFGYYGEQGGDGIATISREEQHQQTVEATIKLLAALP